MPIPIFHGRVDEDGRLTLDARERDRRRAWLDTLKDREVEVTVRKLRTQRSLDQNAFWWAIPVRLCAEHCGYSDDEMHYALLGECFGYRVGPTGREIPNVVSSSKLTVEEFTRLIEWVMVWAPEHLGIEIPAPGSVAA